MCAEIDKSTISIIICTYERDLFLNFALEAINAASYCSNVIECIVVNNAFVSPAISVNLKYPLKMISEPNVGLSHARNSGAKAASGQWLLYLDDDGKISINTLVECASTIANFDFEFFTGIFEAWYYYKAPKWFPDEWASYTVKGTYGVRPLGEDYISGGIMAIRKHTLVELGSFPGSLGMIGNKCGYGEETHIEHTLRKQGRSLGFNSNMILQHVVGQHKMSISWVMSAYYARGESMGKIGLKETTVWTILYMFFRHLAGNGIKGLWKLMFNSNYYWQNFLLHTYGVMLCYIGILRSKFYESNI